MKTYLFFRAGTEDEVPLRDFKYLLQQENSLHLLTILDVNTVEGDHKAQLYDILRYPAIVVAQNNGSIIKSWEGTLPLVRELVYYLHQN